MADSQIFKIASEPWEFDQINKLNYETFVEEIPQHDSNCQRILVDKFHTENTYIICVDDNEVLGMLAVRNKRPFSLDKKLEGLDSYLPPYRSICEIRLLASRKSRRHSRVVYGLLKKTVKYCLDNSHDIAVISGVLKQQKLYEHMGFVPFGPVVGNDHAMFQPMYLTDHNYAHTQKNALRTSTISSAPVILTPGPVEVAPSVRRAFAKMTVSHRSHEFMVIHRETKKLLCDLVNAKQVEILMGSGTLANDVVAAQLSLVAGRGLVLSNGEFGNRLIDSAQRFALDIETVKQDWSQPFNSNKIEHIIREDENIKWLWAVHCETSTGMLNDPKTLKEICLKNNILLCLDCISSIGTIPVDLENVYFASTVSGKGLCSFAGLSMVFYNNNSAPSERKLPQYLDLNSYAQCKGVPFTILSNLVVALNASLKDFDIERKYARNSKVSSWLRRELRKAGLQVLTDEEYSSPAVTTIRLPHHYSSLDIGEQLEEKGFYTYYKSDYLRERNWLQICMMNEISRDIWSPLLLQLRQVCC